MANQKSTNRALPSTVCTEYERQSPKTLEGHATAFVSSSLSKDMAAPAPFVHTSLTDDGMRSLVRLRGGLPDAYRFTAWKYLLRLPGNSLAFHALVHMGPHPAALASFATRYPLRDRKAFRKMAVLISALAHWSPVLGEAEFVPGWVFPFVVVFEQVRSC